MNDTRITDVDNVAPRGGAWIETMNDTRITDVDNVAPRGGAWIETTSSQGVTGKHLGRPSRRGVD